VVRIAVTRGLPEVAVERLRALGETWVSDRPRPLTVQELHEAVRGAEAIVSMPTDRIDAELLAAAGPNLKVVANFAVGYDNFDVAVCEAAGVACANTPDTLVETTADLAFALILATPRRIVEGDRLIRAGRPWTWSWDFMLGQDVWGSELGLVGLGAIAQAVARRARGFGMRIRYCKPQRADEALERELGAEYVPFGELLERSDIVSLHCPLTERTRHLIDAAALAQMKPTAFLVNTARGAVVDEAALVRALDRGGIAGAGLDVYEREPVVHPGLKQRANVVLVPHLGSATVATRERMALRAVANVEAALAGQPVPDDLRGRDSR
jgi:lactate dehydrogenase-like 2-hydroxyacid dehydrogenase